MPNTTSSWTLARLHGLPDDGNRYGLVHGKLFVTPPPSTGHQDLVYTLAGLLAPYVTTNGLGRLEFPRSVVRVGTHSEVEPDLMVRPIIRPRPGSWEDAPMPSLVVEVASGITRTRDRVQKRALYLEAGIPEYWIIERSRRVICVARPNRGDAELSATVTWHPASAPEGLVIDVQEYFRQALDD